jgi:hypothetical protein
MIAEVVASHAAKRIGSAAHLVRDPRKARPKVSVLGGGYRPIFGPSSARITLRYVAVDAVEPGGQDDNLPVRHNVQLRQLLRRYVAHTVPALNLDEYAARVHDANRAAGL